MKQEEASDDQMTRFSEMTTTSSMYTTRRLRLLGQSAREPELMRWSQSIQPIRKRLTPPPQPPASGLTAAAPGVRRPRCSAPCPGACTRAATRRLHSRSLQQVPDRHADSACRFARQAVAERPLSKMPKRFYAAAQAGFSGHGARGHAAPGADSCRRTNKTTRTAGVPLRTGKTGCRAPGDCRRANQTGFNRACRCKNETNCCTGAYECKNKNACPAVHSCSRA